jgi:hypothetical protein
VTWLAHFVGWWTTDRVGAAGSVLGALGTIAAVITALALARRDSIRGRGDEERRLLAQARLVRLIGPRWTSSHGTDGHATLSCDVVNHGERPILDPDFSVWAPGVPQTRAPGYAVGSFWIEPGYDIELKLRLPFKEDDAYSWRVTWRDASGRQWCADADSAGEARPWNPTGKELGR